MIAAQTPTAPVEPPRDGWGRYLILPPDSTKPVGYTRVTTIAKALDDGGGLLPWKATATVVGALRRPGLLARWQQLMADQPDPWYGSPASKDAAKKLVEECAAAGGSSDRAEIGTALHAFIERRLLGLPDAALQANMQADVDAFTATTAAAGIVFDKRYIESIVVLDGPRVAGTADQLCVYLPGVGNVVSDLKTGADLKYSWQSIAVQLAAYAHADNIYHPLEQRREPMPQVSQEVAMVIHLPAGEARCELHLIDIAAGWEAFQMSLATREWRKRRNLASPYKVAASVSTPTPVGSPPTDAALNSTTDTAAGPPVPVVETVAVAPPDAPAPHGLAGGDIEGAFASAPHGATANPRKKKPPTTARDGHNDRKAVDRLHNKPDEGDTAAPTALATLGDHYYKLPDDAKDWIKTFANEADAAGCPFTTKTAGTVRRFEIGRALVHLARQQTEHATVRQLVATVIGDHAIFADKPIGHLIGSMSAAEAAQFATVAIDSSTDRTASAA